MKKPILKKSSTERKPFFSWFTKKKTNIIVNDKEVSIVDLLNPKQRKFFEKNPHTARIICMLHQNGTYGFFVTQNQLLFNNPYGRKDFKYLNDTKEQWMSPTTKIPLTFHYEPHATPISKTIEKRKINIDGKTIDEQFFSTDPSNIEPLFDQETSKVLLRAVPINKYLQMIFIFVIIIMGLIVIKIIIDGLLDYNAFQAIKALPH